MKSILLTLTLITLTVIASFVSAADTDKTIATVNGTNITEWTVKRYSKQRGLPAEMPADKKREIIVEELINRELIYQNAVSIGVDKTPGIQSEVEYQRIYLIAGSMLNRASDRFAVSDADLKKEFDLRKSELGGKEFKARHILLENEADAKKVIADLDKGGNFISIAGERSKGPSAVQGGDLGWFQPAQMVKPFSKAAAKLKKGAYTTTPVKTQFGWHVILLEDTRAVNPPEFDAIKEQIRVGLQNKLIESYIRKLRDVAKIERK